MNLQVFRAPTLLKRDSNTGIFCACSENVKNFYFEKHLQEAASAPVQIKSAH